MVGSILVFLRDSFLYLFCRLLKIRHQRSRPSKWLSQRPTMRTVLRLRRWRSNLKFNRRKFTNSVRSRARKQLRSLSSQGNLNSCVERLGTGALPQKPKSTLVRLLSVPLWHPPVAWHSLNHFQFRILLRGFSPLRQEASL